MQQRVLLGLGMVALLLLGLSDASRPASATPGGPCDSRGGEPNPSEASSREARPVGQTLGSTAADEFFAPAVPWVLVENQGQVSGPARFASLFGPPLWLTDAGFVLRVEPRSTQARTPGSRGWPDRQSSANQIGSHVFLTFEGAESGVLPRGIDRASTEANYFRGNDPERWLTHVPTWKRVRYAGIYPGIDLEVHGDSGGPEYDLVIAPGASPEQVVVCVEGANGLIIERNGTLRIETAGGTVTQTPPHTWEMLPHGMRREIACVFRRIDEKRYGFSAPGRDPARPLVIDPALTWATLVGGTGPEIAHDCAVDPTGAVMFCGQTGSPTTFPVTPGAFDTEANPNSEAYVAKLAPDGEGLEFATFLGGSGFDEQAYAVDHASDGALVIMGGVLSGDFPTTPQAFDPTHNGGADIYVTSLSSDGSSLLWSTFLGGTDHDGSWAMELDALDRPCLIGATDSLDFPLSSNAFDTVHSGNSETFIARMGSSGDALDFSSYFGNGGISWADICVTSEGTAFACGTAGSSADLPVTQGAFDATSNGFNEGFVAGFDLGAGTITACSWLGASLDDSATAIATRPTGEVVVVGQTDSFNFPMPPGGFQPFKLGEDAFLVAFPPNLSTLLYGTFVGGGGSETGNVLAIDASGRLYVAGLTNSTSLFPLTPDAFDEQLGGSSDSFLVRLSPDASTELYGTLLGGSTGNGIEGSHNLAVTDDGTAFLVGRTASTNFPVTPGAFDTVKDGFWDVYVAKFDFSPWSDLGQGLAGSGGLVPHLHGTGSLQPGSAGALLLADAKPLSTAWLIVGLQALDAPFKGGQLVPFPTLLVGFPTDASGSFTVPWTSWPSGLPAGTSIYFQVWLSDPAGAAGWASSNGLWALAPVPAP